MRILDAIQHQFSLKKLKLKKIYFRPTDPNFFQHVTVNTHIFFFWPNHKSCALQNAR